MPETIDIARLKPGLRDRTRTVTTRTHIALSAHDYDRDRRELLDEAFVCHLCGKPATEAEQLEAEANASSNGTNLRASHRSCARRTASANGGVSR